jgi:hypothetical protein
LALFVAIFCLSSLPVSLGQAQTPKPIPITISFDYPKMSVDSKSVDYLKVNTGSVMYWFSRSGASDLIYSWNGTLIGSSKWRLNADTLALDVSGKVSYTQEDYRCVVTRFLALPSISGNITITYDITGERAKTTTTVASGALSTKAISNLNLSWINQVQKSAIVDDTLTESKLNYSMPGGKYIAFDWSDVKQSLGDVATVSVSSLSTSKEAEVVFALGGLGVGESITIDPTDSYNSAGTFTWTCPAGVISVQSEEWGGGGGGNHGDVTHRGPGGGGGAYSKTNSIAVTPGGNYTVIVGAAGTVNGGTGGDSSFGNTSVALAKGGRGADLYGGPTAGGAAASGVGDTRYSGGTGGIGAGAPFYYSGGGGECADSAGNGLNGTSASPGLGGNDGDTNGGRGGNGKISGAADPGTAPGGGGGGTEYLANGGAGAAGKVLLTYYSVPTCVTDGTASITSTTVTLKGNITADGGSTPTQYKFEWDYDSGAPYAYNYTSGAGSYAVGNYSTNVDSLNPGDEVFWRFCATNVAGEGCSAEAKFVTLPGDPSLLHETAQTNEGITEGWTKGTGANKSMLRYKSGATAPNSISDGTQVYFDTAASYETTSLTSATQYSFSVWSETTIDSMQQYSSGYVSDSAYTRPDQPTSAAASNMQVDSIDITWTKAARSEKTKIRSSTVGYPATPADGNPVYFDTGSSTTASGLIPNTQYYFSLFAEDDDSGLYSTDYDTATETTLVDAPLVTTGIGEVSISDTIAQINAEVTYTGGENPTCTFYYGSSDGGTDPGSWDSSHGMGVQGGTFNYNVGSLTAGNTYYYTVYAVNSGGNSWASPSVQFTMGCIEPGNLTATLITDYRIDVTWTKTMPVTIVRAGLDNPPVNIFDGLSVYRGNGTSVSIYGAFSSMSGNLTLRAWADCTTCLACSTFKQSDVYNETYLMLTGNGTGGGGIGDMLMAVYDTNSDGIVDAADYAALAGDADTLDTHHWVEIPAGGGNITFVTDSGNVTGNVFELFGSGTISTSGNGTTIIINGTTFLSLPDTPDSYAGQAGRYVVVNGAENALEFVDAPTGNCTGNCTGIGDTFKYIVLPDGTTLIASGNDTLTLTGTDIEYTGNSGNQTIDLTIGGEGVTNIAGSITLFALIFFSLGSVVTAYAFRKMPIAMVAAAAWAALAFFCFTQSASSNPTVISDYWMAIFWVGIAMVIVSIFEPMIMKTATIDEPEPVLTERSQADEMRAEYEAMQKEMGVGIFKPRARKHRKLPKNW